MTTTSQPSYLFYDLETTGLNKHFDQVLQFAAIRTDLALNELERHEIYIRLNPDVIPSPYAMITHRIGLEQIMEGESEFEAISKIHTQLNTPGTISLGYNTLNFDDEFLRFSFYRNLLPPYTHQFANQCSRMDLYPITILYYLYKTEVINWPILNDKVSLKLENLNAANNLVQGQAHNAMVDVLATVELAKKFMQQSDMWEYVLGYFNKKIDTERLSQLSPCFSSENRSFQQGIVVSGNIGSALNYQAPAISLGSHLHYRNQTLWLRLDQATLNQTTLETIPENTAIFRKKIAENIIILPMQQRFLNKIQSEKRSLFEQNKEWLKQNVNVLNKICDYHQHYKYPTVPNIDIDAALYEIGFATPHEEYLFNQFHHSTPREKAKLIDLLENPIRREQAIRILGRHYPDELSSEHESIFAEYLNQIMTKQTTASPVDFRGETRLTPQTALQQIEDIEAKQSIDAEQQAILASLKQYIQKK